MPATARATSRANLTDGVNCTAGALGSLGYDVLAADERNRFVQGQRLKHVTNPFSGAMDADRITVFLDGDENGCSFHVIGETVGTPPAVRFAGHASGDPILVRKWTSREVAADTDSVARACSE